jgi:hypothetical protein
MNASDAQIKALHAALHSKGLLPDKSEMIGALTAGRTTSSKQLTFAEAHALLADLNKGTVSPDQGKRMRNNIVAMAHELGWITATQHIDTTGKQVLVKDYNRLDNWMLKSSYLKKKLFDYTYEELPKLVTQFKAVYQSYIKR